MDAAAQSQVPDLIPARMLNEYAYCPRLMYLEWVQGEWADSADTHEGRYLHRRVDREQGGLPAADRVEAAFQTRSLLLSSEEQGLIARLDLLEGESGEVWPVDTKRGKRPPVPEGVWEPERVQLCAQGLILREHGYCCNAGYVFFAGSRERVEVVFDDALVARTHELLEALRACAAGGQIPEPLEDSPKCPRCSLVAICLPDEIRRLTSGDQDVPTVRRLILPRDQLRPLYITSFRAYLSKKGECLVVKEDGKAVGEARLVHTSQVVLFGSVQVSTQALCALTQRRIPVLHLSFGGWLRAVTTGMPSKNIELRRLQFRRAEDMEGCLALARAFVIGKIRNSRTLLRRNAPEVAPEALRRLEELARRAERASAPGELLGLEGLAARTYFEQLPRMFKGSAQLDFDFQGRNRRPPTDPVNALLSFCYAMLAKDCLVAVLGVGFDPYLGFYHRPRYGRAALALDLMEEFRPLIADSVVIRALNNGEVAAKDFLSRGPAVSLKPQARKRILRSYERRMANEVRHPLFGYKVSYRQILEIQARLLGRVLSGEIPEYPSFQTR